VQGHGSLERAQLDLAPRVLDPLAPRLLHAPCRDLDDDLVTALLQSLVALDFDAALGACCAETVALVRRIRYGGLLTGTPEKRERPLLSLLITEAMLKDRRRHFIGHSVRERTHHPRIKKERERESLTA
jgi:hypothetical protein